MGTSLQTLPLELIEYIFYLACQGYDGCHAPLLSHINSRLRDIAIDSSGLWTSIQSKKLDMQTYETEYDRIRLYLTRSGSRHPTLSIYLECPRNEHDFRAFDNGGLERIARTLELIDLHLHRTAMITLEGGNNKVPLPLPLLPGPGAVLHELNITDLNYAGGLPAGSLGGPFPVLHTIKLTVYCEADILLLLHIGASFLSRLSLVIKTTQSATQTLPNALHTLQHYSKSLSHVTLEIPDDCDLSIFDQVSNELQLPLNMPVLRTFDLSIPFPWILRHITSPVLTKLQFDLSGSHAQTRFDFPSFIEYILSYSMTLVDIQLTAQDVWIPGGSAALAHLPRDVQFPRLEQLFVCVWPGVKCIFQYIAANHLKELTIHVSTDCMSWGDIGLIIKKFSSSLEMIDIECNWDTTMAPSLADDGANLAIQLPHVERLSIEGDGGGLLFLWVQSAPQLKDLQIFSMIPNEVANHSCQGSY